MVLKAVLKHPDTWKSWNSCFDSWIRRQCIQHNHSCKWWCKLNPFFNDPVTRGLRNLLLLTVLKSCWSSMLFKTGTKIINPRLRLLTHLLRYYQRIIYFYWTEVFTGITHHLSVCQPVFYLRQHEAWVEKFFFQEVEHNKKTFTLFNFTLEEKNQKRTWKNERILIEFCVKPIINEL